MLQRFFIRSNDCVNKKATLWLFETDQPSMAPLSFIIRSPYHAWLLILGLASTWTKQIAQGLAR